MTARERVLVWTVGPLVAVVGAGALFYFCVVMPMVDGETRVTAAMTELDDARTKLAEENRVEKRIIELDPRLREWQRWSVPECPDKDVAAHTTRMQDDYGRLISKLCKDAGLTVKVMPKVGTQESKTAPILVNKTAVYTRFSFPFVMEGSYDALIKMLEQFQRQPLLHKVSKMELTKLSTAGGTAPVRGAVAARPTRGPAMLKIDLTLELLQVNGAEKRYTLLPYSLGYGLVFGPAQAVLYTPPGTAHPPPVLAEPERNYADMVAKNIFFGQTLLSDKLTSDHFEAIRFNKLVCIKRSVPDGCDVLLMPDLKSRDTIPANSGKDKKYKNLIVVANVNGKLYLRVFNGIGEMLFDDSETRLPKKKAFFDALRTHLESLWAPHELTPAEKDQIGSVVFNGFIPFNAMLYDQRKALPTEESGKALDQREDNRYQFLVAIQDFNILDDYNNTVLTLHVLEVTDDGVFFQVINPSDAVRRILDTKAFPQNKSLKGDPLLSSNADQVYRIQVGDFLTEGLARRVPYPTSATRETEKIGKTEKVDKEKTVDKR